MADYTESKTGLGSLYKENCVEQVWRDGHALITPSEVRTKHLWGIPLQSAIKNPLTRQPYIIDDHHLKNMIEEAVILAEAECKIDIFPKQYREKHAFDRPAYDNWGTMALRHKPVWSLEELTITPATNEAIFRIPNEWIDTGLLHQGQINMIPLTVAMKTGAVPLTTAPGGAAFMSIFGNRHWIPAFFETVYTTGFPDGKVPGIINQYIGTIAAMEVLSMLAATYARSNSGSISIDGTGQSYSSPGPELFGARISELADKRKWLIGRIQAQLGMKFISSNV